MPEPRPIRRGRARVAIATLGTGLLMVVGGGFALRGGGDEGTRSAPAAVAAQPVIDDMQPTAIEPAPAAAPVEPSPAAAPAEPSLAVARVAEPVLDSADPQPRIATPTKQRRVARRAPERQPAPTAEPQLARLTLASTPPGATFVVNGEALRRGQNEAFVLASTTVKVTAVLRGYKRITHTIQVGRDATVSIPLERLNWDR